jgi:hypothetical protein
MYLYLHTPPATNKTKQKQKTVGATQKLEPLIVQLRTIKKNGPERGKTKKGTISAKFF